MRSYSLFTATVTGLLLTSGCVASSPGDSNGPGPVLDQAQVIPADAERRLDEELREYNRRTGRALVIATTTSLGKDSIENYATAMFNRLGIGDRKTNMGLLFLVAPNERKVRIEVGYGLEKTITNEVAADILKQVVLPRFARGDINGGIEEGVDALIVSTECRLPDGNSSYCHEKATQ